MPADISLSAPSMSVRPPRASAGPLAWLRDNLFSTWYNAILTVLGVAFAVWVVEALLSWAVVTAVFRVPAGPDYVQHPGKACSGELTGACWPFVAAKFGQFLYGRVPDTEIWRVDAAYLLGLAGLVPLLIPAVPGKKWNVLYLLGAYPVLAYWLLTGGSVEATPLGGYDVLGALALGFGVALLLIARFALDFASAARPVLKAIGLVLLYVAFLFGVRSLFSLGVLALPIVKTELWGGMLVTLVVAVVGIVGSFPVGVLLALGRRSKMPAVRWVSVGFIEFVRGVPLITILFMSSVMLPLFLPDGVSFDKLLRALIGVMLFQGAYMAETIRGGLQAIPRGQYEAADAVGLTYAQKMGLVVLPQALKLVIPGIVNSVIGLFKDTSLVLIIGLFDLLGIVQLNLSDPKWFAHSTALTGYVFVFAVFWIFCFGMSRYSQFMERRLNTSR